MIVLDTNVISELFRPRPHPAVVAWTDSVIDVDLYLTAITVAELRYGLARLPDGRRRLALEESVEVALRDDFQGRILPFDLGVTDHYADVVASREETGRPILLADGQIAAICRRYRLPLATRNTRDFEDTGLELIDPWLS